jgi:hypothetical protein
MRGHCEKRSDEAIFVLALALRMPGHCPAPTGQSSLINNGHTQSYQPRKYGKPY